MAQSVPPSNWINQKSHTDKERWICLYPAYINSKKTRKEGRRIPIANAVENPTIVELRDVLSTINGLTIGVENKAYSREKSNEPTHRGRIRVQLKDENGQPIHEKFKTRDSLMIYAGEMIPKLKSRTGGQQKSSDNQQKPNQENVGGGGGGKDKKKRKK